MIGYWRSRHAAYVAIAMAFLGMAVVALMLRRKVPAA